MLARLLEDDVLQRHDDSRLWRDFIVGSELDVGVSLNRDGHVAVGIDQVGANRLFSDFVHFPFDDEHHGERRMRGRKVRGGKLVIDAFHVELAVARDLGAITRNCEYQIHKGAKLCPALLLHKGVSRRLKSPGRWSMKKFFGFTALALTLSACDDIPERVFFEPPSPTQLAGTWSGTGEITTADDIASNGTYNEYGRGFDFPVVIIFDGRGRFQLYTGNFATSTWNEADRTCRGVYTQSNAMLRLLPDEHCRALPLTTFTIGRRLPNGITLDARTTSSTSSLANYASYRVTYRLTRD